MNKRKQNHLKLIAEATQSYVDLLNSGYKIKVNTESNAGYEYIKLKSGYTSYWFYHNKKFSFGRESLKQLKLSLYRHIQHKHDIHVEFTCDPS